MANRLLVFNPDHDYALASGSPYYMPPASVRHLGSELQFLPLIWAEDTDSILLADDTIQQLGEIGTIEPWGWDPRLRRRLINLGFPENILPSPEQLRNLRRLSHRRISIVCNLFLDSPMIPTELTTVADAMDYSIRFPGCYFKLPWSSGGRGVVATSELSKSQTEEWIRGGIRRQGSIMGEKGITRTLDFASLWTIDEDGVWFDGMSVSLSDGRGKYNGNLCGDQSSLLCMIKAKAPAFESHLLSRQKEFLQSVVFPFYKGKLGIDMMAGKDGTIYPCVEINFRRTMGHVALSYFLLPEDKKLQVKLLIPSLPLKMI